MAVALDRWSVGCQAGADNQKERRRAGEAGAIPALSRNGNSHEKPEYLRGVYAYERPSR